MRVESGKSPPGRRAQAGLGTYGKWSVGVVEYWVRTRQEAARAECTPYLTQRVGADLRGKVTDCLASQARHKLDAQIGCSLARNVVALLREVSRKFAQIRPVNWLPKPATS